MYCNTVWLLIRTELPNSFSELQRKSRSRFAHAASLVSGLAVISVLATLIFYRLAESLASASQLEMLPALAAASGALLCLGTSIYRTDGLLFRFRSTEPLLSLPIQVTTLVTARLIILYLWNLIPLACVMLPACAMYGLFADPDAWFYVIYIIEMVLTPLLPIVIGSSIGILLALASARFRLKGIASMLLLIAGFSVWTFITSSSQNTAAQATEISLAAITAVRAVYLPAAWFAAACCNLNLQQLGLFVGLSIGAFTIFCWIMGLFFRRISSAFLAGQHSTICRLSVLRATDARRALIRKDFKRLLSSSTYFLNTCMGSVLAILLSALVLFAGPDMFDSLARLAAGASDENAMSIFVVLFVAFCTSLTCTTAVSVSLEGRSLWILRTAPVSSREILQAKLMMNYLLIIATTAITGPLLVFALHPDFLTGVLIVAGPLIFGAFTTAAGQLLNLRYVNFRWTDELDVVKRGTPVLVMGLLGMALALLPLFGVRFFGSWIVWPILTGLAISAVLLYRYLMAKGAKMFDALSV